MKKILALAIVGLIAFTGCTKKAAEEPQLSQAQQLVIAGQQYLKQGDPAKAVQSFTGAIQLDPKQFEGYYLLSETMIRAKQFSQAEGVLVSAIKQFPNNGLAYYLLAVAHEGADNLVPAIVAARKSYDLFTAQKNEEGQKRAMVLLAVLVDQAKKLNEAQMVANAEAVAKQAVEERGDGMSEAMDTDTVPLP